MVYVIVNLAPQTPKKHFQQGSQTPKNTKMTSFHLARRPKNRLNVILATSRSTDLCARAIESANTPDLAASSPDSADL
jgi:hypothetical protein